MKREDLKKIEGITDEQIDSILELHKADVHEWNGKVDDQKVIVKKRDETIQELTDKVKEFDGVDLKQLQTDLKDWEKKYNEGLAAKDKEFAKQLLFNNYEFSSNMAKRAAMLEFDEKELKFENGKFLGAEDFFKNLQESDPGTFAQKNTGDTGMAHGGNPGNDDDDELTKRFKELNPGIDI